MTTTTIYDRGNVDCIERQDDCTAACEAAGDRNYAVLAPTNKRGKAYRGPADCTPGDGACPTTSGNGDAQGTTTTASDPETRTTAAATTTGTATTTTTATATTTTTTTVKTYDILLVNVSCSASGICRAFSPPFFVFLAETLLFEDGTIFPKSASAPLHRNNINVPSLTPAI